MKSQCSESPKIFQVHFLNSAHDPIDDQSPKQEQLPTICSIPRSRLPRGVVNPRNKKTKKKRRGCDQNWRQFRLAVSTANGSWRFNNCQFCWQLALPIEIGVLETANFVGSWHWQLAVVH